MATDPHHPWHARGITAALNTVKQRTLALHLSSWACKNLLVEGRDAVTILGEFMGVPATGRRVSFDAIRIVHVRAG